MQKKLVLMVISIISVVSFTLVTLADEFIYLPVIGKGKGSGTVTATVVGTTETATPNPTTTTQATATVTPTATSSSRTDSWLSSWRLNKNGKTSSIFNGVTVNVSSIYTQTTAGKVYQCITASGIPNYETPITQNLIDSLNNRPRAAVEFGTGKTTATMGQVVAFGETIGYSPARGCTSGEDGYGYWPPGPACPTNQNKTNCFPLEPEPTTETCKTGLNSIGTWVNGVAIFNWQDGTSYEGQRVWENDAFHFEAYDLDICPGHSANGHYHHHSHPVCLSDQLGDKGDKHSPIYGFAADGYPVYGPWQADGVLAQSCWKPRDYDDPTSKTGCGVAGERSCLLVDQYDISQGTTPASSNGPSTSDTVSSLSSNQFVTTSGYYFQDYYYDAACTEQGLEYLDKHNGHEHDGLGYHYHVTRAKDGEGNFTDVFPFYIGPTYAGTLQDNAIASCSTGAGGGGPGGGGPGGPPGGGGPGGPGRPKSR